MKQFVLYYLHVLALPLTFGLILLTLYVLWQVLGLPTGEAWGSLITSWFDRYGLLLVFGAAVLEGLLLLGNYFPGSFVIIFGVALSDSPAEALVVLTVGTTGLMIAHATNYALGRYGWYRLLERFGMRDSIERSRKRLIEKGSWAIFGSYWLPSMAAVVDSAAGILHMPFRKFLLVAIAASLFWNSLVTIIAYTLGDTAVTLMESDTSNATILIGIVVGWCVILLVMDWRKRRKLS